MKYLGEPAFHYIMRMSGRKPISCSCEQCKAQCHTPCLGTPEDILKIIRAGYIDCLSPTIWAVGVIMGCCDTVIPMVQAKIENGYCAFYRNGLCELHESGLKPTEGKLSHHSIGIDNYVPTKSLSWLLAQEWISADPSILEDIIKAMKQKEIKA